QQPPPLWVEPAPEPEPEPWVLNPRAESAPDPEPEQAAPLFIGPPKPSAAQAEQARAPAPEAPTTPQPSALVVLLRAIGCWPPEDYARREAGIIQWWAPRAG